MATPLRGFIRTLDVGPSSQEAFFQTLMKLLEVSKIAAPEILGNIAAGRGNEPVIAQTFDVLGKLAVARFSNAATLLPGAKKKLEQVPLLLLLGICEGITDYNARIPEVMEWLEANTSTEQVEWDPAKDRDQDAIAIFLVNHSISRGWRGALATLEVVAEHPKEPPLQRLYRVLARAETRKIIKEGGNPPSAADEMLFMDRFSKTPLERLVLLGTALGRYENG